MIGDNFYGYTDSISADNNPMVLVELTGLSYRYGPTVYAVDRVNDTIYGMFDRGFRVISDSATLKPQYIDTPLPGMYGPMQATQVNTLAGQTQLVIPMAKSTPITQSSQTPMMPPGRMPLVRDILEPVSSEQARADHLERQNLHMGSIPTPPLDVPSNGLAPQSQDETYRPRNRGTTPIIENARADMEQQQLAVAYYEDLQRQVQEYCQRNGTKRGQEQESHRTALEDFRRQKGQQRQQQNSRRTGCLMHSNATGF